MRKGRKADALETMAGFLAGKFGIIEADVELTLMYSKDQIKETGANGLVGTPEGRIVVCLDSRLEFTVALMTMAHEMVHVRQLVTGVLRYEMQGDTEIILWHGVRYPSGFPYLRRPWELEAMREEKILYLTFLEFFGE